MKTYDLAELYLERYKLQTKFVEKIKTHIQCPTYFSPTKSCRLWDNMSRPKMTT